MMNESVRSPCCLTRAKRLRGRQMTIADCYRMEPDIVM
jgi:hypothetical protein